MKHLFARQNGAVLERNSSGHSEDSDGLLKAIDRSLATIQFDPQGIVLDANANFLAAMGYTLDEIRGKHHRIFTEPKYAQSREYEEFWAKLRRGEFDAGMYKRIGKGGREIWIQASYNPVFNHLGNVVKVVKFATDVTAQTRKTADIEGQLRSLHRVQGIIEFDLDGTIRTANDLFLSLVGYGLEEVKGKHHRMFVDPEEARSHRYEEFWQSLRAGAADTRTFKRLGKAGKVIWLQASYIPVLDPDGRPIKVVKFANDLTEIMNQTLSTQRNAESVAAANEEMSCAIAEISRSMELSRDTAGKILATSAQSEISAASLVASMASMEGIARLIREIADRVNILALNAAIEAARAGEAGRGFAVVASEVKNLSNQTAQATDEIAREIAAVQSVSSTVASTVQQTKEGVGLINRHVTSVAVAIEQQSAVTRDISEHSSRMVKSVLEMIERMQQKG